MSSQKVAGVIGFFKTEASLKSATEKVRDSQYSEFDAFTPYPVHGLNEAQGVKRSPLPWVTFIMGITGCMAAFSLEYWTSAVDWPLIVGGKPFNSWPAFVPIMFELTVLFAGVSTVLALFAICRLPNVTKKSFDPSITRDRFAIWIGPEKGKEFNESQASQFLQGTGAQEVRTVYAEGWF